MVLAAPIGMMGRDNECLAMERATLASSIAVTRDGAMESIPFYPDVDNYFIV